MAIYKEQNNLTIQLDAGIDVDAASVKKILYEKPSGTKGFWTATSSANILSYPLAGSDIDESGTWKLQSFAVLAGENCYGTIVHLDFDQHINATP
jgi:hypothetical protein